MILKAAAEFSQGLQCFKKGRIFGSWLFKQPQRADSHMPCSCEACRGIRMCLFQCLRPCRALYRKS